MRTTHRWHVAAAAALLAVAGVHGDVIHFSVFENAQGVNVQALDLRVDLISAGSAVDFLFRNESTGPSVVTGIYIESTALAATLLLNGAIVPPQDPGVHFVPGAVPALPPGSIAGFGGAWGGNLLSLRAVAPIIHNGLSPGESVRVRFDLGDTYAALVQGLSADPPAFRIVQQVQGLEGDVSVWAVNEPIPAPGVGAIAAIGLGFMGLRRRQALAGAAAC